MPSLCNDPREFVAVKQIPTASHVGLKITARCSTPVYTCEKPRRKEVAKDNFERRKFQTTQCGYRSINHKPYKSVGDVVLDDKELILRALGQLDIEGDAEVSMALLCFWHTRDDAVLLQEQNSKSAYFLLAGSGWHVRCVISREWPKHVTSRACWRGILANYHFLLAIPPSCFVTTNTVSCKLTLSLINITPSLFKEKVAISQPKIENLETLQGQLRKWRYLSKSNQS